MKPLKIVIISKNCYPALGPRAHRTTELAKELAKRGHQVIVYALLGDYDYTEYSQQTGIIFKNLGKSKLGITDNVGYRNKVLWARIIRRFFLKSLEIPNIELMFLVQKALKRETEIDYLITVAHPHPIHWGAAQYIDENPNKIKTWVADCGDPFMKDPFTSHYWYFKYFEKKWGKLCDFITVPLKEAKNAYYKEFIDKIKVIPQGFNFNEIKLAYYQKNDIPTFAYSGHVYKGLRDPSNFLNYLATINLDFKFIVYSKSGEIFKDFKDLLGNKLEIREYVPRQELLFQLSQMDFLINIKNESGVQVPSKLIDYALTKRPILEITSKFEEECTFNQFLKDDFSKRLNMIDVEKYDITNIVDEFINLHLKGIQ